MKKILLSALISLGAIGFMATTASANEEATKTEAPAAKCQAGKCNGDMAKKKEEAAKCNGDMAKKKEEAAKDGAEKKEAPAKGKCGAGKCGSK